MDIAGIVITIYNKDHPEYKGETIKLDDISFVANRFPIYRIRHYRFEGGIWWTTELHPPEIGNDSAMELGLEI